MAQGFGVLDHLGFRVEGTLGGVSWYKPWPSTPVSPQDLMQEMDRVRVGRSQAKLGILPGG